MGMASEMDQTRPVSRPTATADAQLALDVPWAGGVRAEPTAAERPQGEVPEAPVAANRQQKIDIKAAVNDWMSANLGEVRTALALGKPSQFAASRWLVPLVVKRGRVVRTIGEVHLNDGMDVIYAPDVEALARAVRQAEQPRLAGKELRVRRSSDDFGLFYGDGIAGTATMMDKSVDLLLTDPPYSISNAYTCERQIPRRLRTDGGDFIMPKGDFGTWDRDFSPQAWTDVVVPKVRGWAVIFCAQAQIGEYVEILRSHGFNAVGTIVWHKTNPVPFNTRFKPVNAWEAGVVGKRPGTKFHGTGTVHNVFTCKSPSPQNRIHPTQKPLGLFRELTQLFSKRGDLLLDPFAGSATTVCAALELRRNVIAFESDERHYRAACDRLSATQLAV